MMRLSIPIRWRLAIVYSAALLASGALLVGLVFGILRASIAGATAPDSPATRHLMAALVHGLPAVRVESVKRAVASHTGSSALLGELTKATTGVKLTDKQAQAEGALIQRSGTAFGAAVQSSSFSQAEADSILVLGSVSVFCLVLGWVLAGRALQPVRLITSAAGRAFEHNLGERLNMTGPRDELKRLADTFDAMLERLESSFSSQQRFVANASHELRTPLAVMRMAVDVTATEPAALSSQALSMVHAVRRAVEDAEALVAKLLLLAKSERGTAVCQPVDLSSIADDMIELNKPLARASHIGITACLDPAVITGDPVLIGSLVNNLVHNALVHNVAGGWVEITTAVSRQGAFVRVTNGGVRISAEAVASLVEPFERIRTHSDYHTRGAGLGLSIARAVVAAHDGLLDLTARPEGGLDVIALLPVRHVPAAPWSPQRWPQS
jgi:signal transduction histidine kinase